MTNEIKTLISLLNEQNIALDSDFEANINNFSNIFINTAKTLNLTAIKEPHDIMIKHYYDSILPKKFGFFKEGSKIIDIGCGGGFPSMPLKMSDKTLEFTLLDSLKKRLTFLDGAINEIGLDKICTLHARAEDAARQKQYRDSFDIAISRAVAYLPLLCELCLPFVKVGGVFLAYKGNDDGEIDAAREHIAKLSAEIEDVITYDLPENAGSRTLVVIRKVKPTHPIYPRSSKALSKAFAK